MPDSNARRSHRGPTVGNVQLFFLVAGILFQIRNDHFWGQDIALLCYTLSLGIYIGYALTRSREEKTPGQPEAPSVFKTVLFWGSLLTGILLFVDVAAHAFRY